jgi:hypothetical protein
MLRFTYCGGRARIASWCAIAVVLLATGSITVSLATRFSGMGAKSGKGTTISSQSVEGKTQRLLTKALQSSAPAARFTLFEPPRSSRFVVSSVFPLTSFRSETWLYNRPPPPSSC